MGWMRLVVMGFETATEELEVVLVELTGEMVG